MSNVKDIVVATRETKILREEHLAYQADNHRWTSQDIKCDPGERKRPLDWSP